MKFILQKKKDQVIKDTFCSTRHHKPIEVFDTPETLFNNKNKTENNMEPLFSDKDAIVGVIFFFTKQQNAAIATNHILQNHNTIFH
jgi:hypothetical protein